MEPENMVSLMLEPPELDARDFLRLISWQTNLSKLSDVIDPEDAVLTDKLWRTLWCLLPLDANDLMRGTDHD